MKIFLFGTGQMSEAILEKVTKIPDNIKILGFIDNNSNKWGEFCGKPVYSPRILNEVEFDKLIIMSDAYFEIIKEDLMYWHNIDVQKIKDRRYLLKVLLIGKYKDTDDQEIREIIEYWDRNEISVYNQYLKKEEEKYIVQWDCIENMPYIMFEDKRMYFPYDYKFQVYDGKKVVIDLLAEQQNTSPHRYIKDNIRIDQGDVIIDAGVQEGNFSLKYIEKVSRAYLFECDKRWIRPLKKTFECFKDKTIIYDGTLGQFNGGVYINLDSVINENIDFLKMDIEGAEVEALLGAKNLLVNSSAKCAICSYHKSGDERAIKDVLSYYGYKTDTSKGYMVFYYDENIYSTLDFRKGIVYAKKE